MRDKNIGANSNQTAPEINAFLYCFYLLKNKTLKIKQTFAQNQTNKP
ncbi:hypothetical protein SAMN04488244_1346 [Vibrio hangzhouensis]|uniref:Uncharacterized protein n=1 Tax=Vibrio hangzhouensis TaxID=462991 RepID=A0A1H6C9W6_9VIBR|nr:hypothetical protein SAMN04488244_1346 [Vibrio hangzhouensis]